MKIARAKPEQAEEISKLIIGNLKHVNSKDYPEEIINELCKDYSKENIIKRLKKGVFIIIVENKKITATGRLEKNIIHDIFVNIKNHKRGTGRKIMSYLEGLALKNGIKKIKIPSSKTAILFYQKLGYIKTGKKTKSSIFMEKKL